MTPTVDSPLTILIDLTRTEREKQAMAKVLARHPGALVVAAYDSKGRNGANINDCFASDGFLASQADLAAELDAQVDRFISKNPRHATTIAGIRTQLFEHNLHELHKWLFTLGQLVRDRNPADLTVVLPAVRTSDEIALFEAEGEISTGGKAHLLYRRTDFLLWYIEAFLSNKGVTGFKRFQVDVPDWLGPTGRRIFRTYGLLTFKAGRHLLHRLRHRRTAVVQALASSKVLALTRSVVHSDYLANLIRIGGATPLVMDSVVQYPSTWQVSRLLFGMPAAHLYDDIPFTAILWHCFRSLRDLAKIDLGFAPRSLNGSFRMDGVSVSLKTCVREAVAARFEHDMVSSGVRNYLRRNLHIKTLIHCELFTPYAVFLAQIASDAGISCFQVAFGTYEMRPITRSVYGSGFLCFSDQQRQSLGRVQAGDERILYRGNLFITDDADDRSLPTIAHRIDAKHLVYYCQPYDERSEDQLLIAISNRARQGGYRFSIVLHPRGRISGTLPPEVSCRVIQNAEYLASRAEIEDDITLALTRTSNVGYQLLLRGVPLANLVVSAADQLVKQEYFDNYPLLLKTADQLEPVLCNIETSLHDFAAFRTRFLDRSYRGLGVKHFDAFLNMDAV